MKQIYLLLLLTAPLGLHAQSKKPVDSSTKTGASINFCNLHSLGITVGLKRSQAIINIFDSSNQVFVAKNRLYEAYKKVPAIDTYSGAFLDEIKKITPAPEIIVPGCYQAIDITPTTEDSLLVVDNYIYHGRLADINLSTIKSITVLKDAAAASIWGQKARGVVIVIQTDKKDLANARRKSRRKTIDQLVKY